MSEARAKHFPDHNPFSTSNVKPGEIAFLFDGDNNARSLVEKLEQHRWQGEIVGPHGSGKSTLLEALLPFVKQSGREVRCYTIKPRLTIPPTEQAAWSASTLVVCEGFELLSRRQQRQIEKACRVRGAGLLITCHQPYGLPPLFRTSISLDLAQTIVRQLLACDGDIITVADVQVAFSKHEENLRELLFEMYDLYEQRSRERR